MIRSVLALVAVLSVAAAATAAPGWPWPTEAPPPTATPPPSLRRATRTPVTRERALEIAKKAVADVKPEASFVVLEKETVEKPFGWVFFYEPSAAAEDPGAVIPGTGPLVVHRADGSTTFLSASVPPDVAIAEYEKVWSRRKR